jgi:ATPase subunit of ABC transporter with duplicated ATPase domains
MKPPGKSTLFRMQLTALQEAERIEISQDGRVACGMQAEPLPEQVEKRDDLMGIVRLIDAIMSDAALLERLQERMR